MSRITLNEMFIVTLLFRADMRQNDALKGSAHNNEVNITVFLKQILHIIEVKSGL